MVFKSLSKVKYTKGVVPKATEEQRVTSYGLIGSDNDVQSSPLVSSARSNEYGTFVCCQSCDSGDIMTGDFITAQRLFLFSSVCVSLYADK